MWTFSPDRKRCLRDCLGIVPQRADWRRIGQPDPIRNPVPEVVFVCTANRARSPFAAALLERHLTGLPFTVGSVGTLDEPGAPALPHAVRAARAFGVDLSAHRARPVRPGDLASTDLVIGFEPYHVAAAVVTGGASRARAFVLSELADAVARPAPFGDRDIDFDTLVGLADARRRLADALPGSIADPAGRSDRRLLETFAEIERIVALVASRLFGLAATAGGAVSDGQLARPLIASGIVRRRILKSSQSEKFSM